MEGEHDEGTAGLVWHCEWGRGVGLEKSPNKCPAFVLLSFFGSATALFLPSSERQ